MFIIKLKQQLKASKVLHNTSKGVLKADLCYNNILTFLSSLNYLFLFQEMRWNIDQGLEKCSLSNLLNTKYMVGLLKFYFIFLSVTFFIFAATIPCQAVQPWLCTPDKPSYPVFSSICSNIVDSVAHFQVKHLKVNSGSLFNEINMYICTSHLLWKKNWDRGVWTCNFLASPDSYLVLLTHLCKPFAGYLGVIFDSALI